MGVSYNVYIGPYIKCINAKMETFEERVWCPRCHIDIKSQFCPRCGIAQETYEKPITDWVVDDGKVYDAFATAGLEYYDTLCILEIDGSEKEEVFYTSNVKGSPGLGFDPKQEFGIIIEEVDPVEDKAKMLESCQKAIVVLKGLYGEDNVSVEWGVVSYCN